MPGEVVLIDCGFLRGLAVSLGKDSRAKRSVGSQRQVQIRIGHAGPALAIGGDHLINLSVAGFGKRLLHVRVQAGIVNRVEHLIREKGDFRFGGADQQRNICRHLGRGRIEGTGRQRAAINNRRKR